MYAGGEGDDVRRIAGSVVMRLRGDDTPRVLEMSSEAPAGESLRFLLGDVVKVKALFPCGIRLQKGVGRGRTKKDTYSESREHRRQCMLMLSVRQSSSIKTP